MKTVLTSLLALCFCLGGCGKKEPKQTPQAKNQGQKQPEKPKGEPAAQLLTGEAAFEILKTGLSGITFDKRNKALSIVVDTIDFHYPSVTFPSRVPPDFPSAIVQGSIGEPPQELLIRPIGRSSSCCRCRPK